MQNSANVLFLFFPKDFFFSLGRNVWWESESVGIADTFSQGLWKMPTCDIITTTFLGMKMVLRCAWRIPLKPSLWFCADTSLLCGVVPCVLEEDTKCMSCSRDWNRNWKLGQFMPLPVARAIWFSDRGIWHHFCLNTHPNTHSLIINFTGGWK